MKVSEADKQQTRLRLLDAAVDVISEKGFKSASMREIARRAEVGDATIYNYFPTKEALLYGYCEHVQHEVMRALQAIPNFHEYSLQEQLHQLVETQLRVWLPAREFLQHVFALTFAAPVASHSHLTATREAFMAMVVDLLDAAIEVGEIPQQPYQELLPRLFWDYMSAILAYWLKDESDAFANTTQVVDRSMDIVVPLLQGALVGKTLDLLSFLFRTHVLANLNRFADVQDFSHTGATKRRFMHGEEENDS
ncbi:MAG TPA: TetR/AcrR family transcriptional regulator [Gammaproteobacteria bacterium]|jgi:AcrR family transcriptional regulator|nr:TetR/AcrR family transcriptional regulator [Gammaproteobacteria bacterium]